MTSSNAKPVWFITGCSTGFGRYLALHTLSLGYPTVVTARDPQQVQDIVADYADHALVLALDVTDPAQVREAVKAAEDHFGHIDVLVNNAGIGYFGSFEESELDEVRRMFEINVWGLSDVTRAALPGMRARRSGTVVNVSSVGGIMAYPTLSFYNASKFAVEAISESLFQEVAPLGIPPTKRLTRLPITTPPPGPARRCCAASTANKRVTRCVRRLPSSMPWRPTNRHCVCCWARQRWPMRGPRWKP